MILDDRFVYQHRSMYNIDIERNIYLKIKYRKNIKELETYYSYFLKINKLLYKIYKKFE